MPGCPMKARLFLLCVQMARVRRQVLWGQQKVQAARLRQLDARSVSDDPQLGLEKTTTDYGVFCLPVIELDEGE